LALKIAHKALQAVPAPQKAASYSESSQEGIEESIEIFDCSSNDHGVFESDKREIVIRGWLHDYNIYGRAAGNYHIFTY